MAKLNIILDLLATLADDDKITLRSLPALYDPNGDITLTVRAVDVATREQFLADVVAEDAPVEPHEAATVAAKAASTKAAKLGGKKGK